jgi:hypothetical protein
MGRRQDTHIGMSVDVKVFRRRPSQSILLPGTFCSTDIPEVLHVNFFLVAFILANTENRLRPSSKCGTVAHDPSQMAIPPAMIGATGKCHQNCSPHRRDRCSWPAFGYVVHAPKLPASHYLDVRGDWHSNIMRCAQEVRSASFEQSYQGFRGASRAKQSARLSVSAPTAYCA